jgi:hypothetical protein
MLSSLRTALKKKSFNILEFCSFRGFCKHFQLCDCWFRQIYILFPNIIAITGIHHDHLFLSFVTIHKYNISLFGHEVHHLEGCLKVAWLILQNMHIL